MTQIHTKLSPASARSKGEFSSIPSAGIRLALGLLCVTVFAGCDTSTGTKTAMQAGAVSKIGKLEVQVSVDGDFSLTLAGAKPRGFKDVPLSYVSVELWPKSKYRVTLMSPESVVNGLALDSQRAAEDAQRAQTFCTTVAGIPIQSIAEKALVDGLQASRRFELVTAVSGPEGASPSGAGTLRVRIENWGLYADSRENATADLVQVGLNATAVLAGADGKRLWEHTDYFTSGMHRPISEYGSSPDLLKSEMEETARRYCARVVNEIRYAK
jgi:hypothetical protein